MSQGKITAAVAVVAMAILGIGSYALMQGSADAGATHAADPAVDVAPATPAPAQAGDPGMRPGPQGDRGNGGGNWGGPRDGMGGPGGGMGGGDMGGGMGRGRGGPGGERGGMRMPPEVRRGLESLDVTAEQQTKIDSAIEQFRKDQQAAREKLVAEMKKVLTAEQSQTFEDSMNQPPGPPPDGMGGPGGGMGGGMGGGPGGGGPDMGGGGPPR